MFNDSSTGGYLVESGTPPLNDQSLRRFLHGVIAGITGIDNELVRQSWAANPAPVPSIDVDWVSYGITSQRPDNAPYQEQTDNDSSLMKRHEEFDIYCIFYGPNSQSFSSILRDGMYLSQNREQLFSVGMGLVGFSDSQHLPELVNDRYFDRTDITMTLRREIIREYPILHFLGAYGDVIANRETTVLTETWEVPVI